MRAFEKIREIRRNCLELLLFPIVQYSLRNSQTYNDFADVAKKVFVAAGEREMLRTTKKVNVSRLSVMTGISRREVTRLYHGKEAPKIPVSSILGRVLAQWEQDKRFRGKSGTPLVLSYQGAESEFSELVETVTKHVNSGTILFELERIGAVKKTARGLKLQSGLNADAFNPINTYEQLGRNIDTLIRSVEENVAHQEETVRNHHLHTEYDNVYVGDVEKIRAWLSKEGKAFHRRARDFISKHDKDVTTIEEDGRVPDAGARVSLVGFSYTEKPE